MGTIFSLIARQPKHPEAFFLSVPQIVFGPSGEGKRVAEYITAHRIPEAERVAHQELRLATSLQAASDVEPTRNFQRNASMLGFSFRIAVSYNNLGVVLSLEKKFAEAHKMLSRAISIQKALLSQAQTDAVFNTGLAYIQAGRGAGKVIEQHKRLLAVFLLNNALVYREEGDERQAKKIDEEAHRLDPSLPAMSPFPSTPQRSKVEKRKPKSPPHKSIPPKNPPVTRPVKELPAFWKAPITPYLLGVHCKRVLPAQNSKRGSIYKRYNFGINESFLLC